MADVGYRWVDGPTASQQDWDHFEETCVGRGWALPNRALTRLLVAEADGKIIGFMDTSLMLHVGRLYIDPTYRGSGVAERMAETMFQFTNDVWQRGFLVVVESQHAAKLCEAHGMQLLENRVYVKLPAVDAGREG